MTDLDSQIVQMRAKMIDAAQQHQMNLLHPDVIDFSEQLDLLILEAMRSHRYAS
ncbi:hypothetical protein FHS18_003288 [Paenibacillus phyllosphaerae]|uniref:Spo0E like sporulation regulatory protein n=1 Tax=Paenibacillus phyllosphaerae TaxID=274593 RepID=A0A7W5FND9_9BACL|nr:Spo0E family sporulation regulatory protein-aspartic acid phosphatase [Paenibacillus phyllosphaerae]MBB3111220.1 hypothetical protein [Paenibacillus phyllosphaerae]